MSAATIELATAALARHEAIIARGLNSFIEVGDALLAIRSERLYLATHETFDAYCRQRWGFSDSRARQLVIAAKAVTTVTAGGLEAPTSEWQARELAKVPEPEREQVWRETLERTDGNPTAAAVREVASPVEPPPVKPEPKKVRKAAEPKQAEPAPHPASRAAPRPTALAKQLASTVLDLVDHIDETVETTININAYDVGDIEIHVHHPAPRVAAEALAGRLGLRVHKVHPHTVHGKPRHEWTGTADLFPVAVNWLEPEDES